MRLGELGVSSKPSRIVAHRLSLALTIKTGAASSWPYELYLGEATSEWPRSVVGSLGVAVVSACALVTVAVFGLAD